MTGDVRSDEEKLADDLLNGYCSAVLVKYIGYISLKKSIREVGKHEQQQICNTCIKIVAHYAGCIKDNHLRKDYTDIIDTKIPHIWNQKASLALSLDSIIISKERKRNEKMLKKPLVKICIQDVSLTGIGTGSLSNFFCIVAKVRTETNALSERRVVVLSAMTATPLGITSAITLAFLLKYRNDEAYQPNSKKRCVKYGDGKEFTDPDENPYEECYSSVAFNEDERIKPTSILNSNANFNNYTDLPTPDESSSVSFICKPFQFHMLRESKPSYKKLIRSDSSSTFDSNRSPRTEGTQIEDELLTPVDIRSGFMEIETKSPSEEIPPNHSDYQIDWEWYEEATAKAEKYGPLAVLEVQRLLLTPPGDPPPVPHREEGIYYPPDLYPPRKKKTEPIPPIVITEHPLETICETNEDQYQLSPEKSTSNSKQRQVKKPSPPTCGHPYEQLHNCLSGRRFLEKIQEECSSIVAQNESHKIEKEHDEIHIKYKKIQMEVFENWKPGRCEEAKLVEEKVVEMEEHEGFYNGESIETKTCVDKIEEDIENSQEEENDSLFVLLANQKSGTTIIRQRSNSPPGRIHMSRSRFEQIAEYLEDMSWFHGIVRREMAESLIIKEGEFLVRQSATFPGQIILTLMDSEDFPQHICLVDLDARIKTSENEFNSIVQLIKYHLTNNIPLVYGDVVLYIRKPVCRPGSTPSSETPTPLGMKRFY